MNDTSGPTSSEPFATYDPDSSSWKTWPAISLWGLVEYSETWPKQGTTRAGRAYAHRTSEPLTDANGSSSPPTLPTPSAADGKGGPNNSGRDGGLNLRTAVTLLPTPSAGQHNYDEDPDQWEARRQRLKAKGINGNGAGTPLGVAVKLLPTPRSQNSENRNNRIWARPLNEPQNIENALAFLLPSASTSPPSTDGPPSSDDQPLILWTEDG